jgi:hypothetical protein
MAIFIPEDDQTSTLHDDLFQVPVRCVALDTLGISVYLLEITQKVAEHWLKTKNRNRSLHLAQLNKIKRSLGQGRWEINGETIILDATGRLIEGQHRCQAVLDTGIPLWSLVVIGIDQENFKTMGQGSKRSAGDILGIRGEHNARHLAAALRWVWRYDNKMMLSPHPPITDDELADTIFQHEDILNSIPYGTQKGILVAPGMATGLHYLFHRVSPEKANVFFRSFADGADLPTGHPILVLRNTLINRANKRQLMRDEHKAPMVILAWNLLQKDPKTLLRTGKGSNQRIVWQARKGQKYPEIL